MEQCIKLQLDKIAEFKPHIVIGFSMGAAVLSWIISRGLYGGPAVLIAPAHDMVLKLQLPPYTLKSPLTPVNADRLGRIVILQGKDDLNVDPESVARLAEVWQKAYGEDQVRFELLDGGHDLLDDLKVILPEAADDSFAGESAEMFREHLEWVNSTAKPQD